MENKYYPMVDAFPQIREALEQLPDSPTVSERWPQKQPDGALIVVTELTNAATSTPVVDELAYQVDVWAEDEGIFRRLCAGVDEALSGIGFLRTLASPPDFYPEGHRRTFRYSRRVDKRLMRLIN